MQPDRVAVVATGAVLLGLTLVSGPLVGVSLTDDRPADPGTGTADLAVERTPDAATLTRDRGGSDDFRLRSPPVRLDVAAVTGRPTVTYELAVEELSYTTMSVSVLDADVRGAYDLPFGAARVDAEDVDDESLDGTLRVTVTDDDGTRTLVQTAVVVEVER